MKAYCEPCQPSKMKRFVKIVNGFQSLTIFAKRFILDVWQCFEYTSDNGIYAFDLDNTHLFMGTSRNFKEYFWNLYRHKKVTVSTGFYLITYLSVVELFILSLSLFSSSSSIVCPCFCLYVFFDCFFVSLFFVSVFFSFDLKLIKTCAI